MYVICLVFFLLLADVGIGKHSTSEWCLSQCGNTEDAIVLYPYISPLFYLFYQPTIHSYKLFYLNLRNHNQLVNRDGTNRARSASIARLV